MQSSSIKLLVLSAISLAALTSSCTSLYEDEVAGFDQKYNESNQWGIRPGTTAKMFINPLGLATAAIASTTNDEGKALLLAEPKNLAFTKVDRGNASSAVASAVSKAAIPAGRRSVTAIASMNSPIQSSFAAKLSVVSDRFNGYGMFDLTFDAVAGETYHLRVAPSGPVTVTAWIADSSGNVVSEKVASALLDHRTISAETNPMQFNIGSKPAPQVKIVPTQAMQ